MSDTHFASDPLLYLPRAVCEEIAACGAVPVGLVLARHAKKKMFCLCQSGIKSVSETIRVPRTG